MTPCNSAGAISRLAVRHRKSRPGPGGVHRHYRRVKPCPMRRSRNLPIGMAWRAECRFEGGEADNHRGLHRSTFRPRGSYVPGPRVRVLTTACALPPAFPHNTLALHGNGSRSGGPVWSLIASLQPSLECRMARRGAGRCSSGPRVCEVRAALGGPGRRACRQRSLTVQGNAGWLPTALRIASHVSG